MDLNSILAIIAAISSVLTLLCTQARKMRVKEVDVCDGHCLKVISSPRTSGENSEHNINGDTQIARGSHSMQLHDMDPRETKGRMVTSTQT
jgi:hypothetical protein